MVRFAASRTTANASGSRSSSVSPLFRRALNSSVLARSSLSVRASMLPSSSFILFTMGMSFLTCASEVLPSSLSKNPIIFLHKPGKRALYL